MFKKLEEIFALAKEADYEKELFEIVKTISKKDYALLMPQVALKYATYSKREAEETPEERKEKKIMGMIVATKPNGHYLHTVDYFGCGCTGISLFPLIKEKTGKHVFSMAKECLAHCSVGDFGFEKSKSCVWEGGRADDRLAVNSQNFHGNGASAGNDAFRESTDATAYIDSIGERAGYGAERIILQAEEIKSFYQPKSGIIIYRKGQMIPPYNSTKQNIYLTTRYNSGDEKNGIYPINHETFRGLDVTNLSIKQTIIFLKKCRIPVPSWLEEKANYKKK
ncbi:MAG: hypothetical protein WC310_05670 [Patescibacteria group bacterium]|jgi:hypothetical protein